MSIRLALFISLMDLPHLDLTLNLWTQKPLWKALKILIFGYRERNEKINKLEYVRFDVLAAVLLKS